MKNLQNTAIVLTIVLALAAFKRAAPSEQAVALVAGIVIGLIVGAVAVLYLLTLSAVVEESREEENSTPISAIQFKKRPQRQDALTDQLRDVALAAEQAGCYDAADFIRQRANLR